MSSHGPGDVGSSLLRAARRAGYKTVDDWASLWLQRIERGVGKYMRHDPHCHKVVPPGPGAHRCTCGLDDAWGDP